jgi:LPPG:FO 2-phospho-L-lactate transferase
MRCVALAGGVGGAKLVSGLSQVLETQDLVVIVNTGDDFDHYGMRICPDLDTVCYTLAGMNNPDTGWGLQNETFSAMENIQRLGGPTWFRLGDRDLGTHLERTRLLAQGFSLSSITEKFCQRWGIGTRVIPMTNQAVSTQVITQDDGKLPFQEYFVHRRCEPVVKGFHFLGIEESKPAPGVLEALQNSDLIILCPSNPWVSIGPILAIPGIKNALMDRVVVAVSPIIGGKAVKGPAAKMYSEMGIDPSPLAVGRQYQDFLKGLVFDRIDRVFVDPLFTWGIISHITDTLMVSLADRQRLAGEVIRFGKNLIGSL